MDFLLKPIADSIITGVLRKNGASPNPDDWTREQGPSLVKAYVDLADEIFVRDQQPRDVMKLYVATRNDIKFEFDTLGFLSEDSAADARVRSEVIRRCLIAHEQMVAETQRKFTPARPLHRVSNLNTDREKADIAITRLDVESISFDPLVTVKQTTFATVKWWGTLGSFDFEFSPIGMRQNDTVLIMHFKGARSNIYSWSKDRPGMSEIIHKLGLALERFGLGRPFPLIANSGYLFVDIRNKEAYARREQIDPKNLGGTKVKLLMDYAFGSPN